MKTSFFLSFFLVLTFIFTTSLVTSANFAYNSAGGSGGSSGTTYTNITVNVSHNALSGLQGGAPAEYYHLTNAQHTSLIAGLTSWITNTVSDLVNYFTKTETEAYINANISSANTSMKGYVDLLNATGLIQDWNSTGYIQNWNSTGYIQNWNATGYIQNWNASGYIKDWNSEFSNDYVPYTGALDNVDLGAYNLTTTGNISATYLFGDGSQLTGLQSGELILYFLDKASSDISGNKTISSIPNSTEVTLTAAALGDGDTLMGYWITDAGVPNINLLVGNIRVHVTGLKSAGTKNAQFFFKIYKTNATGGNAVFLGTSEYTAMLTAVRTDYRIWDVIPETQFNSTDRIMVEGYAYVSGGGSAPTVNAYIQGASATRLVVPVGAVSVEKFVPYTGSTKNLDTGSYNISTNALHTNFLNSTYFINHFLPGTSLTFDLGSGANRWKQLFVQNISAEYGDFLYDVIIKGELDMDSGNVTSVDCITFQSGGQICGV